MKFGNYYNNCMIQEWKSFYIDYLKLKDIISQYIKIKNYEEPISPLTGQSEKSKSNQDQQASSSISQDNSKTLTNTTVLKQETYESLQKKGKNEESKKSENLNYKINKFDQDRKSDKSQSIIKIQQFIKLFGEQVAKIDTFYQEQMEKLENDIENFSKDEKESQIQYQKQKQFQGQIKKKQIAKEIYFNIQNLLNYVQNNSLVVKHLTKKALKHFGTQYNSTILEKLQLKFFNDVNRDFKFKQLKSKLIYHYAEKFYQGNQFNAENDLKIDINSMKI